MESILEEAAVDGVITCRDCGDRLEPDAEECPCGWKNPLIKFGMI